jgi:hypothetical protein
MAQDLRQARLLLGAGVLPAGGLSSPIDSAWIRAATLLQLSKFSFETSSGGLKLLSSIQHPVDRWWLLIRYEYKGVQLQCLAPLRRGIPEVD